MKPGRSPGGFTFYVCPMCKGSLTLNHQALCCQICHTSYPVVEGIPDFVSEDLTRSTNPLLRHVKWIDRLARIYETKLWYPLVLNIFGGLGSPSLGDLVREVSKMVADVDKGLVLDAACGPGTFGRRIASQQRTVYGIDVSMGMLRTGAAYVQRYHISNVHFARAQVEALPFPDAHFEAAICGGALHLFPDTVLAMREIGRTMKQGTLLAVTTFVGGRKGILRFRRAREHVQRDHGVHVFQLPELEQYLDDAGFEAFRPQVYGSLLVFSVRKGRA